MGMKGQVTGFVAVFAGTIALAAADTVLLDAVESGDSAAAQQLLQQGGDVQARGPDGTTALMWAAYHGDAALVRQLIEAGADVSAVNNYGVRALS
jgi:ankyrin repeat protein